MELWEATFNYIVECDVTSAPSGQDRGRIEELFAQLYLLGQRPSVVEVRSYLQERWPAQDRGWQSEILKLWRQRLKTPSRQPKSARRGAWAYPFVIPETLAREHDLASVPDRLTAALADAAHAYIKAVEAEPGSPDTDVAAAVYALTAQAVRFFALSRDRIDEVDWPSVTTPPRANDNLFEYATRAGRISGRVGSAWSAAAAS
jgi:hypothetical protein